MPEKKSRYNLTDNRYLVLVALTEESQHGYGLCKRIEALTDGQIKPSLATIYDALHTLRHQGLVTPNDEFTKDGRHRRMYEITPDGERAVLEKERLLGPIILTRPVEI